MAARTITLQELKNRLKFRSYRGYKISPNTDYNSQECDIRNSGIYICRSLYFDSCDLHWVKNFEFITKEVRQWLEENSINYHPENWDTETFTLFYLRF